jgi:hypothetical protein
VLFHYDGRTTEWDNEFEWSKQAIHISARKQAKWYGQSSSVIDVSFFLSFSKTS